MKHWLMKSEPESYSIDAVRSSSIAGLHLIAQHDAR